MNISETKEKILELYLKSLKITTQDYCYHPVRLVQAVKSIIGVNIEKPIDNLLVFCSNYINKFEIKDSIVLPENNKTPLMVSYKKLEESLLSKDRKEALKALSELKKVSEGSQIFEFFIEYSLKYSNESLLIIWSIYRMSLFSSRKFVNEEFLVCIDSIVSSTKTLDFKTVNLASIKNKENLNCIDLYHVLNSVYYSKTVRNEKMRRHLSVFDKYYNKDISSVRYCSRDVLWSYVNDLKYEDLSILNILEVDGLRAMMKTVEDEKMNPQELYSIINNYK